MVVNTTAHVKRSNAELVRGALLDGGGTTVGLAARTGLSIATCASIVRELTQSGEAIASEEGEPTGGRPARAYRYNPHFAHVLGLFVSNSGGRNRIVSAVSSSTGESLERTESSPATLDYDAIEAEAASRIAADPLIKTLGISVPGIVHRGEIGGCDVAPLAGLPIVQRLRERFGVEVAAENDTNLAAYGYYRTEGRELDSLALVLLPRGNGPGAGIILDGRILRGSSGFAGEVGYLDEGRDAALRSGADDAGLHCALARMLLPIVAVANPRRIVLAGDLLSPRAVAALPPLLRERVPAEHCPELAYLEDCAGACLEGLRIGAQDRLRYRYRLSENY